MQEEQNMPETGEIVVCKVKQVLGYGAFVELVEYDNKKGFVHVSQVASSWVKNIRNHVKEGQVRAAKVLSLDRGRNQIDLSLNKVSSNAQRARIEEWKQLKRCRKMLEVFAKEKKLAFDDVWDGIAKPLLEKYCSLGEAFQEIALEGEAAAAGVEKKLMPGFLLLVKKNVPKPSRTVSGVFSLRSLKPNGVDVIKKSLASIEKEGVDVFYKGGGKYVIRAKGPDFKSAEKELASRAEHVLQSMKAAGNEAKFERSE